MSAPYKVCFLFDRNNNWIKKFFANVSNPFPNKYIISRAYDPDKVVGQDIVFALGFTRILDSTFLAANRLCLVVHESDLPLGKGFAPVQWQILEGRTQIPVCLIEAAKEVDSGDIVRKEHFELNGTELYDEIRQAQGVATRQIVMNFLAEYPSVRRQKQTGQESFYTRRTREDGELDIDCSLREQFNLLRIGNNDAWPSFFYYKDQKYFLQITKETSYD